MSKFGDMTIGDCLNRLELHRLEKSMDRMDEMEDECCDDWHTPIAKTVVNLRERVRLMQQSLERFEKDIGIYGKSDEEVMGIKDWGGL